MSKGDSYAGGSFRCRQFVLMGSTMYCWNRFHSLKLSIKFCCYERVLYDIFRMTLYHHYDHGQMTFDKSKIWATIVYLNDNYKTGKDSKLEVIFIGNFSISTFF